MNQPRPTYTRGTYQSYGLPADGSQAHNMYGFYDNAHGPKHFHGANRDMNGFHHYETRGYQQQSSYYASNSQPGYEQYYYQEMSNSYCQEYRPRNQRRRGRGRGGPRGGGSRTNTYERRNPPQNPLPRPPTEPVGGVQNGHVSFSDLSESDTPDRLQSSVTTSHEKNCNTRQPNTKTHHRYNPDRSSNSHPRSESRKSGNGNYREQGPRGRGSRQFTHGGDYNFRQGTQEDIESQRGESFD